MSEKKINWDDVKKRLHESKIALEKAGTPAPERTEAVFRERAEQLARRRFHVDVASDAFRVLAFVLDKERYGLEFSAVAELFPFATCTPIPGGPPQLLGVINVHGEIRSVVSLGRLLELPDTAGDSPGYVLLVRAQGREVGLRVDGIDKIQAIAAHELIGPGDGDAGSSMRYLKGFAPDRLKLLNTDALLTHPIFTKRVPE